MKRHHTSRKSPTLYRVIIATWVLLMAFSASAFINEARKAYHAHWWLGMFATISALFITYFWLNGVKDIIYTVWYHAWTKDRLPNIPTSRSLRTKNVAFVYCTYNDFSEESLQACLNQTHNQSKFYILDDSTDPVYQLRINAFAATHGIRVIRRDNNIGFKAGNLNNFLANDTDWDYFVILDSDEIVPSTFATRALDYFAADNRTGILQANHIATRNRNPFMRMFSIGVDSHWIAYQAVKNEHGFLSLLGHGAMVSRECYEAAGGFPEVVAEDLCLSIAARDNGYFVTFAHDIVCEEEYPVDYMAFKKRHNKWTQGNMEFIKRYTGTIARADMKWYEKLDIVLFTYSLPLTALFSCYVILHVIVLPMVGYRIVYPLWMLIPTAAFLIAPMLNDILTYRNLKPHKLAWYLINSMLLYGSMFFVSVRASVKSAFGSSTFLVTPKDAKAVTVLESFKLNRPEVAFCVALAAVSMVLTHSIFPVFALCVPALFSVYMTLTHQEHTAEVLLEPAGPVLD